MSDEPHKPEWTYAAAKKWIEDQDGLSLVIDADGRPMVVVTAWGLSVHVVVTINSTNAIRAAFVQAVEMLVEKLRDPPP